MSERLIGTSFITFYSFKGGVGRSMALINTAGILAGHRGFKVLVIDMDLEAPGLSYIQTQNSGKGNTGSSKNRGGSQVGFVDLMRNAKRKGKNGDLFKLPLAELIDRYTRRMSLPTALRDFEDGELSIMPAGKFDGDYAVRLDALQLGLMYRRGLGAPLIEAFKTRIIESAAYDYVLIDSRTGFSDEAGICTRDLADELVIVSGLNRQNIEGTCEFLKSLRSATDGSKRFNIVLSPVPNGEDEYLEKREDEARAAFAAAWGMPVDTSLQIPYHPRLTLTEEPHIFRRQKGRLFEAYQAIERRMLLSLKHDASTFFNRVLAEIKLKNYATALQYLYYLIRLDEGRESLFYVADFLFSGFVPNRRRYKAGVNVEENVSLKEIFADSDGKNILTFLIYNLPLEEGNWRITPLFMQLENLSPELVDSLAQHMLTIAPDNIDSVRRYVAILESRGDFTGASNYYEHLVKVAPNNADLLQEYAEFLETRNDYEAANRYHRRAVETSKNDVDVAHVYANFLFQSLGDLNSALRYYEIALNQNPDAADVLGDYGQCLASSERYAEGRLILLKSFDLIEDSERADKAEVAFTLWLTSNILGEEASLWERVFKYFIIKGFERHKWNFSTLLAHAQSKLDEREFRYAGSLAEAYKSNDAVVRLDKFERWKSLTPLAADSLEVKQLLQAGKSNL